MKAVVLLSGGVDSTTLLAEIKRKSPEVIYCLSFAYGQRHEREVFSARQIARYYDVPHTVITLPIDPFLGSALTDGGVEPVPHGHYEDESMKRTVVPNRNMVLISIATAFAISNECDTVAYAAHAGDHAIYPDCRQAFVIAMRAVMKVADYREIELYTPFLHLSKAEIVARGIEQQVPYQYTWSCYEGGGLHCGQCGTCVERLEAFTLAHAKDPVVYQPNWDGLSAAPDK